MSAAHIEDRIIQHRAYRRAMAVARWLLLLINLLAAGTAAVWIWAPDALAELDRSVVGLYVHMYNRQLSGALAAPPQEKVAALEDMLDSLQDVRPKDRLDPVKRRTLLALTNFCEARENVPCALRTTRRWVDFDAGDLVGRAALARALVATPEKEEEGLAIIESLYRDFPRSDPLAKTYAVLSKGNPTPEERFSIMATSLREGLAAGHWEVFWDAGDGFSEKRRKRLQLSVDTSGRSSLEVLLPAGVHRVRIDLPSQRSLFVRRPTLRLRGMADAPPMELWKEQLELHQMVRSKDELVSAGDVDPFFHFAVPASEGPVKILFAARVEVRLPRGLRAILLSPQAASVRAALVERGDETQVRRFDALKEQAGRQAEFEERP